MREAIKLNGEKWEVRADYRKVMSIIRVLTDPALEMLQQSRIMAALKIFYVDFEHLTDYPGAYKAMCDFLDFDGKKQGPRLIDFNRDWRDIVAAVNKSAGQPIRNMVFLHIEDFLGYLQERDPESTISQKVNIRYALAMGKFSKLTKEQKEWYAKNQDEIDLDPSNGESVHEISAEDQQKALDEFYAMRKSN